MGQIASAYPTAGGLYHWASMLSGRGWGWITAWFNVLGLFFVVSSVDVGVWLLFRDLILVGIFQMDPASFTAMQQLIAVGVILISQSLFNHYGIELTTKLTDFSGYFIFFVAVVLTISLLAFSPVALDFSRLFTFVNVTGAAGGDVIPRTESMSFAFLFGLILVCYTITGYDASAHTSEETRDAQVNVPKGMWQAVFYSVFFGYLMVCSFVLAMPSVEEGASMGWGSFLYVMEASRMPTWLPYFLFIGIVVNNYLCGLAGLTSASRMAFAFARDGGMPFSHLLSHVSTTYRTPTYAIWASAAIAWLSTVYSDAFAVLATACAVFLYFSYISPVVAGFFAEGTSRWPEKGPFNLGSLSKAGEMKCSFGTGSFLLMNIGDKPKLSNNGLLTTVGWNFNGQTAYAFDGGIFVTGSAVQWLRDNLKFIPDSASSHDAANNSIEAGAILLATGVQERPRAARLVPGKRPQGVFTTGSLQRFLYQEHLLVGKRAVIIGAELVSLSALMSLMGAGIKCEMLVTEENSHQIEFPYVLMKWALADIISRTPIFTNTRISSVKNASKGLNSLTRTDRKNLWNVIRSSSPEIGSLSMSWRAWAGWRLIRAQKDR